MKRLKIIFKEKAIPFMFSRTAKNTYIVLFGNSLAMILAFFYTVLLVRVLTLSDFGYYSALFSFLLLVVDIADLGIGSSLARFLPPLKKEYPKMLSFLKSAFIIQIIAVLIIVFFIFITASFISNIIFHSFDKTIYIKIMCLGIFGSALSNFFIYALSAKEKFIRSSIVTLTIASTRFIFLLPLIYFSVVYLLSVVWAQVLSFIVSAVLAFYLVNTKFIFAKRIKGDIKNLLHFASFLGIARSITTISGRLDVIMLMALTDSVRTGIYSTASRVVSLYPLFTASFLTVVGPRISTLKDYKFVKKYLLKIILGTLALIFSIIIFIIIAKPFMLILFGVKSAEAIPVLMLLLISMIFFTGSIPAVALALYYLKKPFILTINSFLQLVVVICGNFFFIPRFGKLGPAYSLIIAYGLSFFVTTAMSIYFFKKSKKVIKKDKFDTITSIETL